MNEVSRENSLNSDIRYVEDLNINNEEFRFLLWDSEVGQTLASANIYSTASISNKGLVQAILTQAQDRLTATQKYSPRNINSYLTKLNLLIDQGAPFDYVLVKLDELITLVPKDQDLKANIAMLCFKLALINDDPVSQEKIINRLNRLFTYSMDYRGMTQIHRHSEMFEQTELLSKVKTNVRN